MATLREERDFDLREIMRRLTWDALSMQAVGKVFIEPEEDRYNEFWTIVGEGDRRLKSRLGMPRLSDPFQLAFARWAGTFGDLVNRARLAPREGAVDLLSVALSRGTRLSDRDLALEIGNVWFGGQMGIASLLVTSLYLLERNPRVRARVQEELKDRLGAEGAYSMDRLESCAWLDGVVREAHRLLPAVPLFFRNANQFEAVELGGYELAPNTEILISNFGLHRDRDHWAHPEHFVPERWHDPAIRAANRYGSGFFFPYGRGERSCAGSAVAVHTIKMILASFLRETGLQIADLFCFEEDFFATVLSYRWLRARLTEPA